MPALHVRDVPDEVMTALRERATAHNRSVQAEVRFILSVAAATRPERADLEPLRLITTRTPVNDGRVGAESHWSRSEIYGDDGR